MHDEGDYDLTHESGFLTQPLGRPFDQKNEDAIDERVLDKPCQGKAYK